MARLGYWLLLGYVLATFTRLSELLLPHGKVPRAMLIGVLLIAVLSGRIFGTLVPRIGRYWYAFMGWTLIGAPFAVWPVGALQKAVFTVGRSFFIFLGIAAYIDTWKRVRALTTVIALSFSWISVYLLLYGEELSSGSRITGELTSTDPNEMGLQMLFAMPLWVYFLSDRKTNLFLRLLALPAIAIALVVMAKSGSRAMVLAAGAVVAYLMLRLSWKRRVQATAALAVAFVAFLAAAPPQSIVRYKTLIGGAFGKQEPPKAVSVSGGRNMAGIALSASESTESRVYLLERSLAITFQNPFLGVGAGMFPVAEGLIAREEGGRRGVWKGTHNAYTEISSQQGIPALILFLMVQWVCWRKLTALERLPIDDFPDAAAMRRYAFMMKVCFVNLLTFAGTLGISENPYFFVLTGIVVALENAAAGERHRYELARKARRVEAARKNRLRPAPRPTTAPEPGPQPVGVASDAVTSRR